jgi:hypothetical protein
VNAQMLVTFLKKIIIVVVVIIKFIIITTTIMLSIRSVASFPKHHLATPLTSLLWPPTPPKGSALQQPQPDHHGDHHGLAGCSGHRLTTRCGRGPQRQHHRDDTAGKLGASSHEPNSEHDRSCICHHRKPALLLCAERMTYVLVATA